MNYDVSTGVDDIIKMSEMMEKAGVAIVVVAVFLIIILVSVIVFIGVAVRRNRKREDNMRVYCVKQWNKIVNL